MDGKARLSYISGYQKIKSKKPVSTLNDIEKKLKEAIKKKNEVEISTLRLVLAAIRNYQIEKRPLELTEDDCLQVLKREAKKRHEAIEAYCLGGRNELADREEQELDIIKKYLPAELSDEQIKQIIIEIVTRTGGANAVNFGQIMGEAMKQCGGQADGKKVSQIVKEVLSGTGK